MKTEHQVSAGGVLIRETADRGPEVLLASRRVRSGEVVWGLPKGIVEEGESREQAALREVREETGWTGEIRSPLGEIEYWYVWEGTRIHKTVHFFLMAATGGDIGDRDREMEEVAWYPLEEAQRLVGFASERDVLVRASRQL